jgi:hypothetical protein
MAIGGGQPPQPFQTGGALDAAMADVNADTAEANAEAAQANANAAQAAISIAGTIAGVPGLGIATNALGQLGSYYGQPEQGRHTLEFNPKSLIPFNPFGVPTIGDQVASQAATAQTNAVNSITNAMVQEDEPESFATEKDWATNKVTNKSEKEHRADIAEAEAETEAQDDFNTAMNAMAMAMSQETEEDNPESVAEAMGNTSSSGFGGFAGFSGIGGNVGQDDTTGDPDTSGNDAPGGGGGTGGNDGGFGSASGPGSGHGDAGFGGPGDADGPGGGAGAGGGAGSGAGDDGGDDGGPFQQGGYLGGISRRAHGGLLQLAEGGSVPYFEGMVRGSGDGMSDNIPFVIAGRQEGGQMGMQPAVLSPDEYVFPADVVSSLGNGSSNAGANQLDQFINNFRMDKYGRPNQPPEMRGGLSSLG